MKFFAWLCAIAVVAIVVFRVLVTPTAIAGEVRLLTWETRHAAAVPEANEQNRELLALLRFGAAAVPEAMVMQFAYRGATALGLNAEQAKSVEQLLADRYRRIAADPVFAEAPSLIAYCYSAARPKNGAATVFVPEHVDATTPVIVFLHGYGGSFQYYLHFFASAFPGHIIVCPVYGISTSKIASEYLAECLAATAIELKLTLAKPTLVGLSAGGFGGFREYARHPERYLGYICLAAYPPDDAGRAISPTGRSRLLAGATEGFVRDGTLSEAVARIRERAPDCESRVIAGADHFFLLSEERQSAEILRAWLSEFESQ